MVGRIRLIILNTPCNPAIAADPTAVGAPAPGLRDVGMSGLWFLRLFGRMVGWLIAWVAGLLAVKSTKLDVENQLSWV